MFEGIVLRGEVLFDSPWQNFEAEVELDQHGLELLIRFSVALQLGLAALDLLIEADSPHHGLFQVITVNGHGQVGIHGLEPLDVGQCGIAQLYHVLLVIVGRDQVDGKLDPLGLFTVEPDPKEIKPQFRAHGPNHIRAGRLR